MKIVDNFLNRTDFVNIKNNFLTKNFPWYLTDIISKDYSSDVCEEKYNYQLVHTMYLNYGPTSEYIQLLDPIILKLKPKSILKVKLNMNMATDKHIEHGYHIDNSFLCKTCVYYLNTNNGYTKFEDGEIVKSEENRMLIFDSSKKHTGSTCTDQPYRLVLNINYIE